MRRGGIRMPPHSALSLETAMRELVGRKCITRGSSGGEGTRNEVLRVRLCGEGLRGLPRSAERGLAVGAAEAVSANFGDLREY